MVAFNSLLSLGAVLAFSAPVLSQATVRIQAVGDSITGSPGCWRGLLWQKLQAANIKNTDFVGTLQPDGCGFSYDGQHDGHGGFTAIGIANNNQLPGWLSVGKPDIVQLQLGTNDVWGNNPPATIINAMSKLVDQMRAQKSTMRILVALIQPMTPTGCSDCPQRVITYNNALKAWAPGKSTSASPITIVDAWTGINTAQDTSDGVHPNSNGNAKLANIWFEPLKAAIQAASGMAPATTSSRANPTTTTRSDPQPTTTTRVVVPTTTTQQSNSGSGAPLWGQCGGQGWTGPTTCATGSCKFSNTWYSQCLN